MSLPAERPRHATVADLYAMPESERGHELLNGEIIEKSMTTFAHGAAQGMLFHVLDPYNRRPGGPRPGGWWFSADVDILFGDNVCLPDVVGWRRERVPARPTGMPVTIVPDWICEVLSTNRRHDLITKKSIYHRHHVGHYWIVDPVDETLIVNRWHPEGYLEVLAAQRGQRVHAEPFEAIDLAVGVLFGDDSDE